MIAETYRFRGTISSEALVGYNLLVDSPRSLSTAPNDAHGVTNER